MNKPTPDGYVIIHLTVGADIRLELQALVSYQYVPFGLFFSFAHKGRFIPWDKIDDIEVIFNSKGYTQELDRWMEEDHPLHIESDPDCTMCRETEQANHPQMFFGMGF